MRKPGSHPGIRIGGHNMESMERQFQGMGKDSFKGWRPNARDQETYHFGMGCLQQGRQHHEKPQSKHADQEKSVQ